MAHRIGHIVNDHSENERKPAVISMTIFPIAARNLL